MLSEAINVSKVKHYQQTVDEKMIVGCNTVNEQ